MGRKKGSYKFEKRQKELKKKKKKQEKIEKRQNRSPDDDGETALPPEFDTLFNDHSDSDSDDDQD